MLGGSKEIKYREVVGTHLRVLSFLCSTRIRSEPLWEYYWYSVFFKDHSECECPLVLHVQSLTSFGAFYIITSDWTDRDKNRRGFYSQVERTQVNEGNGKAMPGLSRAWSHLWGTAPHTGWRGPERPPILPMLPLRQSDVNWRQEKTQARSCSVVGVSPAAGLGRARDSGAHVAEHLPFFLSQHFPCGSFPTLKETGSLLLKRRDSR